MLQVTIQSIFLTSNTRTAAARPHIKIEQVRFNGGTAFDDDGNAFIPNPEPIDYEGQGPEVDHAWDVLTGGL